MMACHWRTSGSRCSRRPVAHSRWHLVPAGAQHHCQAAPAPLLISPNLSGDTAVMCQTTLCGLMCLCSMPLSTAAAKPASNAAGRGTSWGQTLSAGSARSTCASMLSTTVLSSTMKQLPKWLNWTWHKRRNVPKWKVHYAVFLNVLWQWPVLVPQEKKCSYSLYTCTLKKKKKVCFIFYHDPRGRWYFICCLEWFCINDLFNFYLISYTFCFTYYSFTISMPIFRFRFIFIIYCSRGEIHFHSSIPDEDTSTHAAPEKIHTYVMVMIWEHGATPLLCHCCVPNWLECNRCG